MTITKLKNCNKCDITLDMFDIVCRIQTEDDLNDTIEIIRQQFKQWGEVKLRIKVKHLVGVVK